MRTTISTTMIAITMRIAGFMQLLRSRVPQGDIPLRDESTARRLRQAGTTGDEEMVLLASTRRAGPLDHEDGRRPVDDDRRSLLGASAARVRAGQADARCVARGGCRLVGRSRAGLIRVA